MSKIKYPKWFSVYSPPIKPFPPVENIVKKKRNLIACIKLNDYTDYPLSELLNHIDHIDRANLGKIYLTCRFDHDPDSYDVDLIIDEVEEHSVPNPDYEKELKVYKKELSKYNKQMVEWKKLKAQWDEECKAKKEAEERKQYEKLKKKFGD